MNVNDKHLEPTQSFVYEIKEDSAVILRCFSRDTKVEIPEQIEGYPVTEVGPYAFSAHMDEAAFYPGIKNGRTKLYIPETACLADAPALTGKILQEIVFPASVKKIGKYCFYNCANLEKITFGGELRDWGAGAFTGVHHVKELTVTADAQGKTSLKQVLDELHEEIAVIYFDEQGREAHLVFPEYFEEGVENTPARILEEKIHGSGMMYRNCIKERRMDFRQYDTLFEHAGFLESGRMTMQLALGRLWYPIELSDKARQQYEAYTASYMETAADLILEKRDLSGLEWLLNLVDQYGQKKESLMAYLMEQASKQQFLEAISFLMNLGRENKRPKRRRFEL